MSTRCTIAYDDDFHLFQECFENNNVYLTLDGPGWEASLETSTIDWRDGERSKPSVHLKVDVTLWRKIVAGWEKSHWAADPTQDHRRLADEKWNPPEWLTKKVKEESDDDKA